MTVLTKDMAGFYTPGTKVQLRHELYDSVRGVSFRGIYDGDWVTIVSNYASSTGVVVVKNHRNEATHEIDGQCPVYDVEGDAHGR